MFLVRGSSILLCFLLFFGFGIMLKAQGKASEETYKLQVVDDNGNVLQEVRHNTENLNINFKTMKLILTHPQVSISGKEISDDRLKSFLLLRKIGESVEDVPFSIDANVERTVFTITIEEDLELSQKYMLALKTKSAGIGYNPTFDGIHFTTSEWLAFQAGGFGNKDFTQVMDMTLDAEKNIYICGYFSGSANFGPIKLYSDAKYSAFLAKYNPNGKAVWATKVDGNRYSDYAQTYALTLGADDNVYVTGRFNGSVDFDESHTVYLTSDGKYNVFLAKYSPDGEPVWARESGGKEVDYGYDIIVDKHNDIYVTGGFTERARFDNNFWAEGAGGYDTFIAKYNDEGTFRWVKVMEGLDFDDHSKGRILSLDDDGNIYLSGNFRGNFISGQTRLKANGSYDIFISKITPKGTIVWTHQIGGFGWDYVYGLQLDEEKNMYITGTFTGATKFGKTILSSSGRSDIFILKINQNKKILWVKNIRGSAWNRSAGLSLDVDNNVYISGKFYQKIQLDDEVLRSTGFSDVFTAKYNSEGELMWAEKAGSKSHNDDAKAIYVDQDEDIVYVSGNFNGYGVFSGVRIISRGNTNAFVWKIEKKGDAKIVTKPVKKSLDAERL